MKEKYEKPVIESEDFSLEMMHAPCDYGPGTPGLYVVGGVLPWYPICQSDCTYSKVTPS